jgi:hypothetical protein
MASNVKWFKRAYRALSSGEMHIWEAIKKKLPEERINQLEATFMQTTEEEPLTEEKVQTDVLVSEPRKVSKPKKSTKKTTTRKTPKKTTNRKNSKKTNEKLSK